MLINLSDKNTKVRLYARNKKTGIKREIHNVNLASKECFVKVPLEERNKTWDWAPEWVKYSHRGEWELFMEVVNKGV